MAPADPRGADRPEGRAGELRLVPPPAPGDRLRVLPYRLVALRRPPTVELSAERAFRGPRRARVYGVRRREPGARVGALREHVRGRLRALRVTRRSVPPDRVRRALAQAREPRARRDRALPVGTLERRVLPGREVQGPPPRAPIAPPRRPRPRPVSPDRGGALRRQVRRPHAPRARPLLQPADGRAHCESGHPAGDRRIPGRRQIRRGPEAPARVPDAL